MHRFTVIVVMEKKGRIEAMMDMIRLPSARSSSLSAARLDGCWGRDVKQSGEE